MDDDLYGDIEEAEDGGGGGNGGSSGGGGNPQPRSSDKYDPEEAIEISVRQEYSFVFHSVAGIRNVYPGS
jgi:hypothetical protein